MAISNHVRCEESDYSTVIEEVFNHEVWAKAFLHHSAKLNWALIHLTPTPSLPSYAYLCYGSEVVHDEELSLGVPDPNYPSCSRMGNDNLSEGP